MLPFIVPTYTHTGLRVKDLPPLDEERTSESALDEPRVSFKIPGCFRKAPDRQLVAPLSILSLYHLRC
jgi:hypothetical protein